MNEKELYEIHTIKHHIDYSIYSKIILYSKKKKIHFAVSTSS